MSEDRVILLAAGGTGGHLFPAEALANALIARGYVVELATDERAVKYGANFPARATHQIPSATPSGRSLTARASAYLTLMSGTMAARRLIKRVKPLAVVGFGGYPTVPPLIAASMLKVPTLIHEQNAVIGRANAFLAKRVDLIAHGFDNLAGVDESQTSKLRRTGNPVRPSVIEAAAEEFPELTSGGKLYLLVTGGSQGARVMSDVVPAAIELLEKSLRARLRVTQQTRHEDAERVAEAYMRLNVDAQLAPFFDNLPHLIARSHLVIARSGASTVSELAVIGRASILVPFPHALDQDQAANAVHLSANGAATMIRQTGFTPERLADLLLDALENPRSLQEKAEAAKEAGIADAADLLADLVHGLATKRIGRGVRT
jgi:UDP-N-acetylglucosamine--N-acetylmuramyl-(pentapeptide) pyrophosphoryl-undecaprenol N-acetylglucosamine transferase